MVRESKPEMTDAEALAILDFTEKEFGGIDQMFASIVKTKNLYDLSSEDEKRLRDLLNEVIQWN